MTDTRDDVLIRPATEPELRHLPDWAMSGPVTTVAFERLAGEVDARNYRPEWTWVAERDGRIVAHALWWGQSDASRPATLDLLAVDPELSAPETVGAALIRAGVDMFGAGPALEFNVDVAPGWADDPGAVAAVRWREAAAHGGGLAHTTERVSFARSSTDPIPERPTRLRFAEAPDERFHELFAQVATGSLDAHTLDMVAREGVQALADDDLAFYRSLPGKREAWRVAELLDGTTVGFIIPTRTAYDASISYLGVLPDHRGHGYVHDLLAEMVHVHHDDGQDRIVGTTDAANVPMRNAFERAAFSVTRVRIVHAQAGDGAEGGAAGLA